MESPASAAFAKLVPVNAAAKLTFHAIAPSVEVTVNGKAVRSGEQPSLNQTSMNIRINRLEFEFQYTDIAYTGKYYRDREGYMTKNLSSVILPNAELTPTPSRTFRCFGEWTISNFLGKGAYGRVSSATNSKGEVVAIKVVERDERKAEQIDHEIRFSKSLTKTVRLNFDRPFIANLFYDALLGLNFQHSNNWVHGDIKPGNIGILDGNTPRVVLLDFGGAVHLTPERQLPATRGRGGTVNYLAPERELQNHDHSIDVWSMGIIGFEFLYGYHPWKIAVNPWRPREKFETLRLTFHDGYRQSVEQMEKHNNTEREPPISRGSVLEANNF
ncbi:hypothetical protein MauCBS54593_007699 [Microsporum audouinii]